MISNVKEKAVSNTLIQWLKNSMVARGLETADCLILSHKDDVLTERVAPVMLSLDSLLLEQPQSQWEFGQSPLASTITWAIKNAEIHSLYICGHSLADSHPSSVQDAERYSAQAESGSKSVSILDRLFENQKRLQDAKTLFANQVDQILEIPAVEEAIQGGGLKIHALFFLAQAGAFMSYDPNSGEFQPLVPSDSRM